jgi:hypothetical protein
MKIDFNNSVNILSPPTMMSTQTTVGASSQASWGFNPHEEHCPCGCGNFICPVCLVQKCVCGDYDSDAWEGDTGCGICLLSWCKHCRGQSAGTAVEDEDEVEDEDDDDEDDEDFTPPGFFPKFPNYLSMWESVPGKPEGTFICTVCMLPLGDSLRAADVCNCMFYADIADSIEQTNAVIRAEDLYFEAYEMTYPVECVFPATGEHFPLWDDVEDDYDYIESDPPHLECGHCRDPYCSCCGYLTPSIYQ